MKVLANTLLLLVSLLVSVAIGEVAVRLLYPVPTVGYGSWSAYPGSVLQWDSQPDNFSSIHRYNSFGFRGEDFSIAPSDRLRLVAVGDSYTEGQGADESESWPAQLEDALADAEVLNLGDGGATPRRYSQILAKVAFPLRPDHILLSVIPSDFYGMRGGYGGGIPIAGSFADPLVAERPDWLRPLARLFRGYTYLFDRVQGKWPTQQGLYWTGISSDDEKALVDAIAGVENVSEDEAASIYARRISRLGGDVLQATRDRRFNPSMLKGALIYPAFNYRVGFDDMLVGADKVRQSMAEWLRWYAQSAKERNIVPWLVYFPHASQVVDGPWGIYEDAFYSGGSDALANTDIPSLLEQLSGELGIEYIDLTPALKAHGTADLFLRYDTHPSAEGYRVAAEEIARRFLGYQGNALPPGD